MKSYSEQQSYTYKNINNRIEEHEQKGVTVPNNAVIIFALYHENDLKFFLLRSGGRSNFEYFGKPENGKHNKIINDFDYVIQKLNTSTNRLSMSNPQLLMVYITD